MKKIIGLLGKAGSGKDTSADLLIQCLPKLLVGKVALADPLKSICREVFDFSEEQLYGPSEKRNAPDSRYTRADGQPLTPRHALQQLGTEWGRACYPNVWIDLGIRRALHAAADVVLITDCRFENEARAIRAAGGEVWKICRSGSLVGSTHASEQEIDSFEMARLVTREIDNSGSLETLKAQLLFALALSGLVP